MISRYQLEEPKIFNRVKLGNEPLICVPVVSLDKKIIEKIKKFNKKIKLIEIRFDSIFDESIGTNVFSIINSIDIPYIFTFRSHKESEKGSQAKVVDDDTRIKWYTEAIENGASIIDFELSSIKINENFKEVIKKAKNKNVGVILSYHNFNETPDLNFLLGVIEDENKYDADILKFATMIKKISDLLVIDQATYLARATYKKPIISMGMGYMGKLSRISTVAFGSDIIFAYIGKRSAPGQLSYSQVTKILSQIY
ncbi:MAG: type I 3-dehydroquinate dehydratase [Thermoplasmata archaeon]